MSSTCPSCFKPALIYSASAASVVCSACGALATPDALMNLSTSLSSSLQTTERALGHDGAYVDEDQEEDLYMLASLRGDIEDETEGGRTFLSGGGTGFGENGGARMVGTVVRKLGAREEYQQRKLNENAKYMKKVLLHFEVGGLYPRAAHLLAEVKRSRPNIKWGIQTSNMAIACCYVAAREREKDVKLVDMAVITELDHRVLIRAQNSIKNSLKIKTVEIDPVLFLEKPIVHFKDLLASAAKPRLSGSKNKNWNASNLVWLRSLALDRVRDLATELIAFSHDISLVAGRTPEPVACASVLVAMEGVARRSGPANHEIISEMCDLMGCKPFTVAERYRELNKVLLDYAPRIPWLAHLGNAKHKNDIVACTEDIVKFRKALDLKGSKGKEKEQQRLDVIALENEGGEMEEEGEAAENQGGEEEEEEFRDPLQKKRRLTTVGSALKGSNASTSNLAAPSSARPLITAKSRAAAALLAKTKSIVSDTDAAIKDDPDAGSSITTATATKLAEIVAAPLPWGSKRPEEYMRKQRPGPARRQKTIERAATSLLIPFAAGESSSASASTSASASDSTSTPLVAPSLLPLVLGRTRTSAYTAHSQETVDYRERLLAGHAVADIYNGVRAAPKGVESRLDKLLWLKLVHMVEDDELFGPGEMEGFMRSEEEVAQLEKTGKFFGVKNTMEDDGNRRVRKRKLEDGEVMTDGRSNRVRKVKSKVDDAMKERIAKTFAGLDDEAAFADFVHAQYDAMTLEREQADGVEHGVEAQADDGVEEDDEDGEEDPEVLRERAQTTAGLISLGRYAN